jgi:hypothetical protein
MTNILVLQLLFVSVARCAHQLSTISWVNVPASGNNRAQWQSKKNML